MSTAARPIIAILQARMSSTRLPGKVMRPILGEPMLGRQLERLSRCRNFNQLVVATSLGEDDTPLADWLISHGYSLFRGALDDVLDRFYQAAKPYQPSHVVRLTGDCPLADPAVIDLVIAEHLASGADYTSNCFPATLPDGLDVEVFRFEALESAWRDADKPSQREHVTPYIRDCGRFRLHSVSHQPDLSSLRWTVDEPADFAFVEAVYGALYRDNPAFTTDDVLALLRRQPHLVALNHDIIRNAGLERSLQRDKELGYE